MEIVIDASAIIAVIAKEPERSRIIKATAGADLIAPPSVHWEIGNAFSAMMRRERVTEEQALNALRIYDAIPIQFVDVELSESIQIASRLSTYAYDAYMIRCALKHRAPLLTLDQGLVAAAGSSGVEVIEVSP